MPWKLHNLLCTMRLASTYMQSILVIQKIEKKKENNIAIGSRSVHDSYVLLNCCE